jgi:hypothetical protein
MGGADGFTSAIPIPYTGGVSITTGTIFAKSGITPIGFAALEIDVVPSVVRICRN